MRLQRIAASGGRFAAVTSGLVATVAAWSPAAQAQVTGSLEVKLLVTASCDITGNAAGGNKLGNAVLDFGTATLLQSAITASSGTNAATAFEVLCNPGVAYTLNFDAGQNAAVVANRAMKLTSGTETVSYQLYTDAGRGTILSSLGGTGTGTAQAIEIFGTVPSQAAPKVGSYKDIITVTMTF